MLSETKADIVEDTEIVKAYARELGFDLVGITSAEPFSETEEVALERVRDGLMDGLPWYNAAAVPRRFCPTLAPSSPWP